MAGMGKKMGSARDTQKFERDHVYPIDVRCGAVFGAVRRGSVRGHDGLPIVTQTRRVSAAMLRYGEVPAELERPELRTPNRDDV
jgi:hypothetical protein